MFSMTTVVAVSPIYCIGIVTCPMRPICPLGRKTTIITTPAMDTGCSGEPITFHRI